MRVAAEERASSGLSGAVASKLPPQCYNMMLHALARFGRSARPARACAWLSAPCREPSPSLSIAGAGAREVLQHMAQAGLEHSEVRLQGLFKFRDSEV